jgi:uncharacterized protein (UPF0335 family)
VKSEEEIANEPAGLLYLCGRGCLHGAQFIGSSEEFAGRPYLVVTVCFLFGFAFELLLKSYLANVGFDEKKLKDLNHDLKAAYEDAMRHGFTSEDETALRSVIDWLSDHHKKSTFRYMKPGEIDVSKLAATEEVLVNLDRRVRTALLGAP